MYNEREPAKGVITLYCGNNSIKYNICSVKGYGGSSIVYEADCENGMKCIIKEFAPVKYADYTYNRKEGHFSYPEEVSLDEKFIRERERFINSCSMMNELAFREETAEESIISMLLYGKYNVPYIVMEWNPMRVVSLEKESGLTLYDISCIALSIARTLREYHKLGLLHLDIKPDNILWSKKYRYVKLIDLGISSDGGELTDRKSIPEGGIGGEITAATDIYAVGALMFELILKRKVNPASSDRTIFGYESELGNLSITENISPKALVLLKKVLRGSICAAPGRRMNDDDFVEALSALASSTDSRHICLNGNITPCTTPGANGIISKNEESIAALISENGSVIITSDDPLSGKSELARRYSTHFSSRYHTILWIDGRRDIYSQITFVCPDGNDINHSVEDKQNLLMSTADRNTLIIIDNLDGDNFNDICDFFIPLSTNVIITTRRSDTAGRPVYIKEPLTETEAGRLYSSVAGARMPVVLPSATNGNPALISEFALCCKNASKTELKALRRAAAKGYFTSQRIKQLLGFEALSEKEIDVIKCLSLISEDIETDEFCSLYNTENEVRRLIRLGWIKSKNGRIALSKVIKAGCCGEYSADSNSCRRVYRMLIKTASYSDAEYIGRRINGADSEVAELYCVCAALMQRRKYGETARRFYERALLIYTVKYGKDSEAAMNVTKKIESIK